MMLGVAALDAGTRISAAMDPSGGGRDSWYVPLRTIGSQTATHYGLNIQRASDQYRSLIFALQNGGATDLYYYCDQQAQLHPQYIPPPLPITLAECELFLANLTIGFGKTLPELAADHGIEFVPSEIL